MTEVDQIDESGFEERVNDLIKYCGLQFGYEIFNCLFDCFFFFFFLILLLSRERELLENKKVMKGGKRIGLLWYIARAKFFELHVFILYYS